MMRKKSNIIVCSMYDFPAKVKKYGGLENENMAYISIMATDECAKYYLQEKYEDDPEDNEHFLPEGPRVCNVKFDDLKEDREYQGHMFKTITEEQADKIVDFIERNLGKHFLIHCRAGASRSQGVYRFMMDMYPSYYTPCIENDLNPCLTPNAEVVRKLKRAYYKKHKMYEFADPNIVDNRTLITKEVTEDSGKYVVLDYNYKPNEEEIDESKIQFLVGAMDGMDDYYYLLLDKNLKLTLSSCVIGYKVLRSEPKNQFMNTIPFEEHELFEENLRKKVIEYITMSAMDFYHGLLKKHKEDVEVEEIIDSPENGILFFKVWKE